MIITIIIILSIQHGVNASMILNANNCTGLNKNNTLIQYLAWRVMTHIYQDLLSSCWAYKVLTRLVPWAF